MQRLPLAGIRVLELAAGLAGAYAARLLGDAGAEVIRVGQRPEGKRPEGEPFADLDCNKYGFSLELNHADAASVLQRLLPLIDVVLTAGQPLAAMQAIRAMQAAREDIIVVALSEEIAPQAALNSGAAAVAGIGLALWRLRHSSKGTSLSIEAPVASGALAEELPPAYPARRETLAQADGSLREAISPHWRFSEAPLHLRLPAPMAGEHNDYVLRGLLGFAEGEVAALRAGGALAAS